MNVKTLNLMALIGVCYLAAGCSSTEALREKYISADIRKAEELAKKNKKLDRTISSNNFGYGTLPL
ncbi:MAG: hypothetical protein CME70_10770 [Halobacteriovorax sp.]|nr:hypothetical protein [Halobacteriovorax sp.]|tara:strand:- start:71656 stop:71853 length:198 start_codon:yes stop_codon:yes gene_type:complete